MNNRMKRKVAAIDESVALKSLHTIIELGKEYKFVVVPKTVVDKINNTNKQLRSQFFRIFLMNSNVIIRDYIDDNRMFDFAMDASKEFKCPVDIISYDDHDGCCYRYISNIKVLAAK